MLAGRKGRFDAPPVLLEGHRTPIGLDRLGEGDRVILNRWQKGERILFELRLYNRRPCCLVRYRHGGYAAIFPMGQKSAVDVAASKTGTGDIAIATETPETGKVLPFPGQTERPGRKKNTRLKGRPNGRKKS